MSKERRTYSSEFKREAVNLAQTSGKTMADRIDNPLVAALTMALQQCLLAPGQLFHCDRGSQYTSQLYRQALADYGLELSMSRLQNYR